MNLHPEHQEGYKSSQPDPLVVTFADILKDRPRQRILEICRRESGNASLLAEYGHQVTSWEIEPAVDWAFLAHLGEVDSIITTGTLHYLNRSDGLGLIERMQFLTPVGGYNVISTYGTGDESSKIFMGSDFDWDYRYFFGREELTQLYAPEGWQIITLGHPDIEKEADDLGQTQHRINLIARKVQSFVIDPEVILSQANSEPDQQLEAVV